MTTATDTSTDRETLLRRWAELAPGECGGSEGYHHIFYSGVHRLLGPGRGILRDRDTSLDTAMLLAAVIAALSARNWACTLTAGQDSASAYVCYNHGQDYQFCQGTELCDVLLAAYVRTLEVATA